MNYKVFCVILLLTFTYTNTYSQRNDLYQPDARLYTSYDSAFLDTLTMNKSNLILYLNYYLDSAYFILELPESKFSNIPDISEVREIRKDSLPPRNFPYDAADLDFSNINILRYNFIRHYDQQSYYKLGNTGRVLVFYSGKELSQRYQAYKCSVGIIEDQ